MSEGGGSRFLAAFIVLEMLVPASYAATKANRKDEQYQVGYQAGRRDERADLCRRFEKHSAAAETLLGEARMVLIRAFSDTSQISLCSTILIVV